MKFINLILVVICLNVTVKSLGQNQADHTYRNLILTGISADDLYTIVYFIDSTGGGYLAWMRYDFTGYSPKNLFLDNGNNVDRILNPYYVGKTFDVQFVEREFYFENRDATYAVTAIGNITLADSLIDGFSALPRNTITARMSLGKCLLDENRNVMAATFYSESGAFFSAETLPAELPFKFEPHEYNDEYLWATEESTDKFYEVTYYLVVTMHENGEKSVDMHVLSVKAL